MTTDTDRSLMIARDHINKLNRQLAQLRAERQQLQEERDRLFGLLESANRQKADANDRCEQAIDALREIARVRDDRADDPIYTRDVAADALLSLGEQP